MLKATKVDGIYDKDPVKHSDAKKFDKLSYEEALELDLKVMDATAIALCRDNDIEIRVVDLFSRKNVLEAATQKKGGTSIRRYRTTALPEIQVKKEK